MIVFFFSSRRRHTRLQGDWSSDVCSSDLYLSVVDLIRTPEDIRDLTYGVARDMAAQNIRYAELTCTPRSHLRRGIDGISYLEAIEDARVAARRDFGLSLKGIFDIPGESGVEAAADT